MLVFIYRPCFLCYPSKALLLHCYPWQLNSWLNKTYGYIS